MYLGIDLGTSSVKAILLDDQLQLVAQAQAPLTVSQPYPLWSEQDPAAWWQATECAIAELRQTQATSLQQVQALGLSGQQHGAVLLNQKGHVLRPAILWNDGRSYLQCQQLEEQVTAYASITGNRIMPGFTAPKLLWVQQNEPSIFAKIHQVLLPKDYLRYRLSGDFATDLSDAAGTSWVDVAKRVYSEEMILASGLSVGQLPRLYEGTEITGTISTAVANAWGIPAHTPIVAGAGDNAASAMSAGIVKSGQAFLSLGTSGVYFVVNQDYRSNPFYGVHSFCHCLPQLWHQMTVHLSAAASLFWLANQLNLNIKEIIQLIEKEEKSHDNLIFLPYLSGERSPHNDPFARGVFFGMSQATRPVDLVHAVMEGVAFAFLDGQIALADAGVNIQEVNVMGGGAQSHYWGQLIANVLQKPLTYRTNREVGAALGAARLAWLGTHPNSSVRDIVQPPAEKIIEPQLNQQQEATERYLIYRELYQRNKDLFSRLVHLRSLL